MEIFGVSPVEFLIVAVLGLIIFGPERLPEVGRFLGRTVAKVLAWQYTSPEAQMLNELKRDFEKQIYDIRDEMVRASQQLDVRSELQEIQRETEALIRGQPYTSPANTPKLDQIHLETPQQTIAPPRPETPTTADATLVTANEPQGASSDHAGELSGGEIMALTTQIQLLSADLQALREQLVAHGVLASDWQTPLHDSASDIPDQPTPDDEHETVVLPHIQTEDSRIMQPEETI